MPPPSSFNVRGPATGSSWAIAPPRPPGLHAVAAPPPASPRHAVSLAGLLLTAAAPGSPEAAAAAEARIAVRDALGDVPPADRLLVDLRVFHGWSVDEIAQLAAGSSDEVAERLDAILARLGLDLVSVLPVPDAPPAQEAAAAGPVGPPPAPALAAVPAVPPVDEQEVVA